MKMLWAAFLLFLPLSLLARPYGMGKPHGGAKPSKNIHLASGTLVLDGAKDVVTAAKGIKTLFLVVYESGTRMPYGAKKVVLTKDAVGSFYKFKLGTDNIQMMRGGVAPAKLKIKARLDKDGSAGPDSVGDVVGIIDGVNVGTGKLILKLKQVMK